TSTSDVSALQLSSGEVAALGRLPQPFHDGAGAIVGGRLFAFGGGAGEGTDVVQAFDLAKVRSSVVGHLPVPLSDLAAITIGATVYLIGGLDGTTYSRAVYATTNGTSFRRVGDLPQGLRYAAVFASGRNI